MESETVHADGSKEAQRLEMALAECELQRMHPCNGTPGHGGRSGHPNRFSITRKKGMGPGTCPLSIIRSRCLRQGSRLKAFPPGRSLITTRMEEISHEEGIDRALHGSVVYSAGCRER